MVPSFVSLFATSTNPIIRRRCSCAVECCIPVSSSSLGRDRALHRICIAPGKRLLPQSSHTPWLSTQLITSPQVGNQAFADYVDALGMSVTRINNKQDLVPVFPPKFLKYQHVSGEVHIRNDDVWVSCPGACIQFHPRCSHSDYLSRMRH